MILELIYLLIDFQKNIFYLIGFIASYITRILSRKEMRKILCVATGALLNPVIVSQKESIPGIAHAVVLEAV